MKVFTIDAEENITVHASPKARPENGRDRDFRHTFPDSRDQRIAQKPSKPATEST